MMSPFFDPTAAGSGTAAAAPRGELMRSMVRLSCAILFLFAGAAKAQFLQFTAPGGPDGRPETAEQRLEREIEEAPYRLGPAYIAPVVGFRDAAYVRKHLLSGAGEHLPP